MNYYTFSFFCLVFSCSYSMDKILQIHEKDSAEVSGELDELLSSDIADSKDVDELTGTFSALTCPSASCPSSQERISTSCRSEVVSGVSSVLDKSPAWLAERRLILQSASRLGDMGKTEFRSVKAYKKRSACMERGKKRKNSPSRSVEASWLEDRQEIESSLVKSNEKRLAGMKCGRRQKNSPGLYKKQRESVTILPQLQEVERDDVDSDTSI